MGFEITRAEIDVASIGQTVINTPFRTFISGFADGSGSASVYSTDDDTFYLVEWLKTLFNVSKLV